MLVKRWHIDKVPFKTDFAKKGIMTFFNSWPILKYKIHLCCFLWYSLELERGAEQSSIDLLQSNPLAPLR